MDFVTKKRSLPFKVGKKSSSSKWIPFAEFEANYLARVENSSEEEIENLDSSQSSSKMSASRRAWNLMTNFPWPTTATTATSFSRIRMKFDPTRLDRMPEIESGIVQRLASGMDSRVADRGSIKHISKPLSFGEHSVDAPSVHDTRNNAEIHGNPSPREISARDIPAEQRTWSETIPRSSGSSSIFAPSSSAELSCNSCTQSDIFNAVQRVRSDEVTVPSMKLNPDAGSGNKNARAIESPEAKSYDFKSPSLASLLKSINHSRTSSSKTDSRRLLCTTEEENSGSDDAIRAVFDVSQAHDDEEQIPEIAPLLRNDSVNVDQRFERSAEEKMAENILHQRKLLARKKSFSRSSNGNIVSCESASF